MIQKFIIQNYNQINLELNCKLSKIHGPRIKESIYIKFNTDYETGHLVITDFGDWCGSELTVEYYGR